jgi:hypothetical protein
MRCAPALSVAIPSYRVVSKAKQRGPECDALGRRARRMQRNRTGDQGKFEIAFPTGQQGRTTNSYASGFTPVRLSSRGSYGQRRADLRLRALV